MNWPKCSNGDRDAIDPTLYDDCEKYFVTPNGEILCKDCMMDFIKDNLEEFLDEVAAAIGHSVQYQS